MQQFIDWLVVNWQFVSSAAISIVSFILLLIFRRKVLINADKPALYEDIIAAVKLAEERWPDGNGDKKLKFVNDWLKEKKGAFFYSVMAPFINQCVEAVLSTPQKKEK